MQLTADQLNNADIVASAIVVAGMGIPVVAVHGMRSDGVTCMCPAYDKCKSPGKHPMGDRWQASGLLRSEAEVRFVAEAEAGRINFGGAWGHPIPGDGRVPFVVDVDTDQGKPGFQTLAELRAKGLYLPRETMTLRTGGGGLHVALLAPPGVGVRNHQDILPGVDIRGMGGQSVLPPGRSSKGVYQWVRVVPLLDAPQWLLEALEHSSAGDTSVPVGTLPRREDLDVFKVAVYDAHEQEIVKARVDRLDRLHSVPPGSPPHWDLTVWQCAADLVKIANAPWSALTVERACALVREHAPTDQFFTHDVVEAKIRSAVSCTAGRAWPEPEPNGHAADAGLMDKAQKLKQTAKIRQRADREAREELAVEESRSHETHWATMDSVMAETTDWVKEDRVALSFLTLLSGAKGGNKTRWCAQLAADVTQGNLIGDLQDARDVIWVELEDPLGQSQRPMLELAGAALERVHFPTMWRRKPDGTRKKVRFLLEHALGTLEAKVREARAALIVISPLHYATARELKNSQEMGDLMDELAGIAERNRCAVLLVVGFNKVSAAEISAMEKLAGSHAIYQAAKSLLWILPDPDYDPADKRFVLTCFSNLTAGVSGLCYQSVTRVIPADPEAGRPNDISNAVLEFRGPSSRWMNPDSQLAALKEARADAGTGVGECMDWLTVYLEGRDDHQAPSNEVMRDARVAGFGDRMVRRAFARLLGRERVGRRFPREVPSVPIWFIPEGRATQGDDDMYHGIPMTPDG